MNVNLYQVKKKETLQIASAPDIPLLENLGIRTGTKITVKCRYAWGGPMLLLVEDTYSVAIGKDIASQIQVTEYSSKPVTVKVGVAI